MELQQPLMAIRLNPFQPVGTHYSTRRARSSPPTRTSSAAKSESLTRPSTTPSIKGQSVPYNLGNWEARRGVMRRWCGLGRRVGTLSYHHGTVPSRGCGRAVCAWSAVPRFVEFELSCARRCVLPNKELRLKAFAFSSRLALRCQKPQFLTQSLLL